MTRNSNVHDSTLRARRSLSWNRKVQAIPLYMRRTKMLQCKYRAMKQREKLYMLAPASSDGVLQPRRQGVIPSDSAVPLERQEIGSRAGLGGRPQKSKNTFWTSALYSLNVGCEEARLLLTRPLHLCFYTTSRPEWRPASC